VLSLSALTQVAFYQLKSPIDMKAFDVGGWCNYCS
jgi:hypothetical protein